MITSSARSLAIFLLLLNGLGALVGGCSLISDPTGASLGLPSSWVDKLPFTNYLIPGIILLLVNGVLSVYCALLTIVRGSRYEKFIIAQGIVLIVWILVQVSIFKMVHVLHVAMFGIGLTIIALGMILSFNQANNGFNSNGNNHI